MRTTVALLDFFICVEHFFEAGRDIKINRYEPLCDVITKFLGEGEHNVFVVPVPIGRSGIPPPHWSAVCDSFKCRRTAMALWKDVQTSVLSYDKSMFNTWQTANGLGM